jgi:hypothetical protein
VIPARVQSVGWWVIALAAGCEVTPPPLTPQARAVQVLKADPPEGSTDLGPITAYDGFGCGALVSDGTYEGAVANLRRQAAAKGANYAEIVGIVPPHEKEGCENSSFTIHAHLFRVAVSPAAAAKAPRVDACDPPCSPGYACKSGVCTALCNPPCDQGMVCRQDRTCGLPPRTDAPTPPVPGENP